MDVVSLLGLAASVSLLAGWRLYLAIAATGLAMRLGALPLPEHLANLDVLANPWVMGTAAVAAVVEFFADKIMWLDSIWDAVHTLVRPLGGALLALAIVDPADPATQAVAFILGGGASLAAHVGKAGTRAVVNASPEPVTNMAVSSAEDVVTAALLYAAYKYPALAAAIAAVLLVAVVGMILLARRIVRKLFRPSEADRKPGEATPGA